LTLETRSMDKTGDNVMRASRRARRVTLTCFMTCVPGKWKADSRFWNAGLKCPVTSSHMVRYRIESGIFPYTIETKDGPCVKDSS